MYSDVTKMDMIARSSSARMQRYHCQMALCLPGKASDVERGLVTGEHTLPCTLRACRSSPLVAMDKHPTA